MANGTDSQDRSQNVPGIADLLLAAPEETVRTWVKTVRDVHQVPAPDTEDLEELRSWLVNAITTYGPPIRTCQDLEDEQHPIYREIEERGLRSDPYKFLAFLEPYGLKIRNVDLLPGESVLDACLAYLETERFHEHYLREQERKEEEQRRQREARRNIYITDRRLRDITELSLYALLDANDPPLVFVRGGQLCRVIRDEHGNPVIRVLDKHGVKHVLERVAEYWKFTAKGNQVAISPPDEVVLDLMEIPDLPLPPLAGIIECPTLLETNEIVNTPGYIPDLRLFYAPLGDLKVDIPEKPTTGDIKDSIELLNEIFIDFPFDSEASRANTIGALCTAVLRPAIGDCCPMVLLDKPQMGTGASIIADVISLVASGRCAGMMTAPVREEEWKKAILSILFLGRSVVVVDNIEGTLRSAALASVLTARTHTDRVLGRSEMLTMENNAVWIGTGNNIQLGGDMARRCYWIRMDAQSSRPWQRPPEDFRHPDLRAWVISERDRILSAILTLARAWILAGKPDPRTLPPMGSYERWRLMIGGIMEFSGVKDFLGNLEEMYSEADTETPQWEGFLEAWYHIWRDNPVKVGDINRRLELETDPDFIDKVKLLEALPDAFSESFGKKRSFVRILGKALSTRKGRVYPNGYSLKRAGIRHQAVTWIVTKKGEFGSYREFRWADPEGGKKLLPQERLPITPQNSQTPTLEKGDQDDES